MTGAATLSAGVITELAQDIWVSLLSGGGQLEVGNLAAGELWASVEISGAWNGTASLSCSAAAGRRAAAVMFGMEEGAVSGEEVADAVGELINVVGGNIKRLVPGPTALSLPMLHEKPLVVSGCLESAQEVAFSWLNEPVVITVWNRP